jgi:hypothetical protein
MVLSSAAEARAEARAVAYVAAWFSLPPQKKKKRKKNMAAAAAAAAAASAPPAATATAAAAALAPASSRVLQWNVLGVAHMDPAARAVCEFLYRHANVPHLEVEAKLGTLESGGARFLLGILDDCVIDASRYSHPHFVPGVSAHVFRKLNELLGHRVKHLAGGVQERLRQLYRRREETDRLGQLPSGDQVREIRDKKSQAILQTQIKRVVDHLDFSNNAGPLDYRLSVKVEIPTRVDETVKWSKVREKNRVSYFIGIWSVDVTYVRTFKANEVGRSSAASSYYVAPAVVATAAATAAALAASFRDRALGPRISVHSNRVLCPFLLSAGFRVGRRGSHRDVRN